MSLRWIVQRRRSFMSNSVCFAAAAGADGELITYDGGGSIFDLDRADVVTFVDRPVVRQVEAVVRTVVRAAAKAARAVRQIVVAVVRPREARRPQRVASRAASGGGDPDPEPSAPLGAVFVAASPDEALSLAKDLLGEVRR
jgi:alkanesulfonate monooxygenase SsuD/methylene tetrahydromethanopterin reductase-like flavin-dependent oxidoreductase (luciferase family)